MRKIQQPTIGRIVLLTEHDARYGQSIQRPAIVTLAVTGEHRVNLWTYGDSMGWPFGTTPGRHQAVPHEASRGTSRWSWSWPERVELPDIEIP